MPYFTAASVVRFYVFRGIFFVGHTHCRAPVQKIIHVPNRPIVVSTAPSGLADGDAVLHSCSTLKHT